MDFVPPFLSLPSSRVITYSERDFIYLYTYSSLTSDTGDPGLPAPNPGPSSLASPLHSIIQGTTFEPTVPRQTPGWAPRKGPFHLELALSWALREKQEPAALRRELGADAGRTRPDPAAAQGQGGRHLLAAGEKCAYLLRLPWGLPGEAVLAPWQPGARGPQPSLPHEFLHALFRHDVFTRQRCVRHYKSLALQTYAEGQPCAGLW